MRFLLVLAPIVAMAVSCGNITKPKDKIGKYVFDEAQFRCSGYYEGEVRECGSMKDADLSGQSYVSMSLRGFKCSNCKFVGTDFTDANLFGIQLTDSDMSKANLTNADATGIYKRVKFTDANLHGARFVRITTEQALRSSFSDVSFKGAEIDSRSMMYFGLYEAVNSYGMKVQGGDAALSPLLGNIGGNPFTAEFAISGDMPFYKEELARLRTDFSFLSSFQLEPGEGWFEKVFGGSSMNNVIAFVDKGTDYFGSESTSTKSDDQNTLAMNYTVNAWRRFYNDNKLGSTLPYAEYNFNGKKVVIDHVAVKVITLGPVYNKLWTSLLRRLSTIIHEARHSYCPEAPTNAQVKTFIETKVRSTEALCNYGHALCPAGHDLSGQAACDDKPFGSYGVAAIFAEKVAKSCTNCSEEDLQQALVTEKETKSRVLILEDMMSGKLGDPKTNTLEK